MSVYLRTVSDQFNGLPIWVKAIIGTTTPVITTYEMWYYIKPRKSPFKTDYKKGLVYLYQFPRCRYAPSASPFCLKLETWLRMAGIKYEVLNDPIPLTLRSKEGTLPFVELDGKEYCDSGFAIRDLTEVLNSKMTNVQFTDEQESVARAFEQMVENSTIWTLAKERYLDFWNAYMSKDIVGPDLVWIVRLPFVRWLWQSAVRKRMIAHGIGKHSNNEIDYIGISDIQAISDFLGSKEFFLGEQPHRIDAVLFGFLTQIIYCPVRTSLKKYAEAKCTNLISYCDRIKAKFWPDWLEVCENLTLNTQQMLSS